MAKKIDLTFWDWSGLLNGRISTIHANAQRTTLVYHRITREFVMEDRHGARHTLAADVTDLERLNAHWLGFNAVERQPKKRKDHGPAQV